MGLRTEYGLIAGACASRAQMIGEQESRELPEYFAKCIEFTGSPVEFEKVVLGLGAQDLKKLNKNKKMVKKFLRSISTQGSPFSLSPASA